MILYPNICVNCEYCKYCSIRGSSKTFCPVLWKQYFYAATFAILSARSEDCGGTNLAVV
jgi:hypothetical protein